jgi:hypothetical protein
MSHHFPDLLGSQPPDPLRSFAPTPFEFCRQSQPSTYLNIPQGGSKFSENVGVAAETTPDVIMHPESLFTTPTEHTPPW